MANFGRYVGIWSDGERVEQLAQLVYFQSLGSLDSELVLVGVMAELVQLSSAQLV